MAKRMHKPAKQRFDLEDIEPVRIDPEQEPEAVEQIHAFSIGEDDYYVPTKVPARVALKSLKIAAERGQDAATAFQLETVLGKEGFEALTECESITDKQLETVFEIVNQIVMGSLGKGR